MGGGACRSAPSPAARADRAAVRVRERRSRAPAAAGAAARRRKAAARGAEHEAHRDPKRGRERDGLQVARLLYIGCWGEGARGGGGGQRRMAEHCMMCVCRWWR